jgi:hypothetical protein
LVRWIPCLRSTAPSSLGGALDVSPVTVRFNNSYGICLCYWRLEATRCRPVRRGRVIEQCRALSTRDLFFHYHHVQVWCSLPYLGQPLLPLSLLGSSILGTQKRKILEDGTGGMRMMRGREHQRPSGCGVLVLPRNGTLGGRMRNGGESEAEGRMRDKGQRWGWRKGW